VPGDLDAGFLFFSTAKNDPPESTRSFRCGRMRALSLECCLFQIGVSLVAVGFGLSEQLLGGVFPFRYNGGEEGGRMNEKEWKGARQKAS
jgi:hypothetical protein